jgi:hypothetical protein
MADRRSATPKKDLPVGTDTAVDLSGAQGDAVEFSFWDLWYALVAVSDFDGDLEQLAEALRTQRRATLLHREDAVRKLSHLRDLQQRLREAGITVDQIVSANPALSSVEKRRAPGRILKHNERQYERSAPMHGLPRDREERAARRGKWPRFPVSPEPFADQIASGFRAQFYSERQSLKIADRLGRFTQKAAALIDRGNIADGHALLRAVLTAAMEITDRADDSFGAIGEAFGCAWEKYLDVPWREAGLSDETFLADLLEFLIWDDYAFTWRRTTGYFERLSPEQAEVCYTYLNRRVAELRALDLDYQSEKALALLGQVAAEQESFLMFEDLARRMAAREWERITLLADRAVKASHTELAERVFEAALTEGHHLEFLRRKYEQLRQGKWDPDPRK